MYIEIKLINLKPYFRKTILVKNYILTEKGLEIAERAARIARHSGRKTVQAGDIKLAVK